MMIIVCPVNEISIQQAWSEHIYDMSKTHVGILSGSQQGFVMRGMLSLSNKGTSRYDQGPKIMYLEILLVLM